ncbi:MAG: hypothetical protein MJY48_02510 [Bacteroidales bacterium]|nr:hypothetical protein [Bacteroidales bacterium]
MKIRTKDIHCHILPGLDDGFQDAGKSLEAIRMLAKAGCREITFTPHINPEQFPDTDEKLVRERYAQFVKQIPPELGITTSLAAEYMIVNGFEKRAMENPESLLCSSDKSVLIEMSYYYRSPNLEETVMGLVLNGYRPIIAHPERYLYMATCLDDFDSLRGSGCRFQLNYLSLAGYYGPSSVRIIKYLAKNGWCDFFSTDLHTVPQLYNILHRPLAMPIRFSRNPAVRNLLQL